MNPTKNNNLSEPEHRYLIKEIRFVFDERHFTDPRRPLDDMYGQVEILFHDNTAAKEGTTRGKLGDTIANLVNRKYREL